MSFKFAARTILELGKELISSDEVALYELIKNAVDAGSPRIEIAVHNLLGGSRYREAVERLTEEGQSRSEVLKFVRAGLVDSDRPVSEELLASLKKCSGNRSFLQTLRSFHDDVNYIEIRDTGHGMSLDELKDVFLRIGTYSRRNENLKGAQHLGDKGIGRLSAMRLGDRLRVTTTKRGEQYWNLLDIDWALFAGDEDVDADSISLEPELGDEKIDRDKQGTVVRISALRGDWDKERFTDMLQGKVARMVDPFIRGNANRLIVARHNGTRVQVPSIRATLLRAAHAVCHVEFRMEDDTPVIEGEINYRLRHRKRRIDAQGPELYSLTQEAVKRRAKRGHAAFRLIPIRPAALKRLDHFKCDIYWFNRNALVGVEGLSEGRDETRKQISYWSGGPMLYRYGYRILPYGDLDDDWLGLDEAAFGASGFKLNRQQVIGRVRIDTPHSALSEKTDREGLIDSDTFNALQKILIWIVHTEMRGLINLADKLEQDKGREADLDTQTVAKMRARVEAALQRLCEQVGDSSAAEIKSLSRSVESLAKHSQDLVERIDGVIKEADQEREKYVYLAGIGLMTEFIFHELERAVSHAMEAVSGRTLRQSTIESLREQLKTLHKRIAAFDELTTEKRQRKSTVDLAEVVDLTLENHIRKFERHGIVASVEPPDRSFKVKAVRGMVIQILENLIVNAAYWLKEQRQFETDFRPTLKVSLDADAKTVTVEDNGPGVIVDRREHIFQPFISLKPSGLGRGLGLYISREMAEYHGWKLRMTEDVGRVRDGRLNAFVLDMG
ncbi:MAG: sensor histidine kinase [Chloroflexi bacterium]|nr:sensor histidine kinase [Chloroflexota bacterium]